VLIGGTGRSLFALEEGLAILVELEAGNNTVAGVNGELSALSVGLFFHDFINVNASAATVNSLDLAFTALEGASHNLDSVSFTDGNGTNFVLDFKIFRQMARHHDSANTGGSSEVGLSGLSTLAGHA
jgi:hypothetical protein